MADIDYDRLADLIMRKMEKKFLRLPDEWHDNVQRMHFLPPMTVPMEGRPSGSDYFLIQMYILDNGGLKLTCTDAYSRIVWERHFQ